MEPLPREIKKVVKVAVILILITLLVVNPFGSAFVTSLTSQEFFSYHLRDLIAYLDKDTATNEEYYIATGTYEEQLGGPLFGAAQGKNLIMVQVESLQNMVIGAEYQGQELTPELNALIGEQGTAYFDNIYQQVGSGNTSDAEFAVNNSMLGAIESYTYQLFQDNYFKGLPWLLQEKGYTTGVFHGFKKDFWNRENIYPALGFQHYYGDTEFQNDNIKGIGGGTIVGISDRAFFQQSMEYMKELPEPYYSFLVTLSSHNPFKLPDNLKEIQLLPEDETILGDYLNSVHYADKCIGEFVDSLKESGMYEDSILVFYGDHFGLTKSDPRIDEAVSGWLGYEYTYDNMLNIPLIVHMPGAQVNETISVSGGQIDIMPTLAYLMGFETLDTIYLGQNLMTADAGLAPIQTHMLKGSFIKDDVVFEMSRDGVYENGKAWGRLARREIKDTGPYFEDYVRAKEIVELSNFYLYNDILRKVYLENKDISAILSQLDGSNQLPEDMKLFYVESENQQAMREFMAYMKENQEEKVLLGSDDVEALLRALEVGYSGVGETKVGEIKSVDEGINAEYTALKSRIVPFLEGTEGYTKVEYLGYFDIVVKLNRQNYSPQQIQEFVTANDPCGIALDYVDLKAESNGLLSTEIPIFLYGKTTEIQRAAASSMGVYGFVEGLLPEN